VDIVGTVDRCAFINLSIGELGLTDKRPQALSALDFTLNGGNHQAVSGLLRFFGQARDSGLERFWEFQCGRGSH
jgi:hypothetical protein